MANTIDNQKNSELDALKAQWQSLSQWALQKEMSMYYAQWDFDKWDALRDFIREKNNPSTEDDRSNKFEEKYKIMQDEIDKIKQDHEEARKSLKWTQISQDKIKEQEEINAKMNDFFAKDMQTYVTETKDSVHTVESAKNAEIDKLKAQLSWIVSEWPKLWEYLSLKRRRLVTINSKIEDLKTGKNKENYPKNVLVYLMALTQTSLFWARQWIKRGFINLTWRRKTEDIKNNLQVINDKLKVESTDSPWTKWLKTQLQQHLLDAKQAYVKKQSDSVGLAS